MEQAAQRTERRNIPPPRPPPPSTSQPSRQSSNPLTNTCITFKAFQHIHDLAYKAVEKGLSADEEENLTAAEQFYTECLQLLDQAMDINCEKLTDCNEEEKDSAKTMQQKMTKSRLQITYRLEALRQKSQPTTYPDLSDISELPPVRLPSYEEATSSSGPLSLSLSDTSLGNSILSDELQARSQSQTLSPNATELFSIPDGVQIFYITEQGYVSAPSYPSSLHIVRFEAAEEDEQTPPAFLQVGEWFYPLIPGASPVLHTSYGAYIFPDLSTEASGSSVGLMLPDNLSAENRHCLEDLLRSFSAVQEQQTPVEPQDLVIPSAPLEPTPEVEGHAVQWRQMSTSEKISKGILIASEWISWGVGKGAEKAGELIRYGSVKLQEKIQPEANVKQIDPRVQKGMVYVRLATHTAVKVSSFIVKQLGNATVALGKQLAPHVRAKGEKLFPKTMNTPEGRSKIDGVIEVAASGLQGFGTVYMGLEGAAKALARSLANETVSLVRYKYGQQAGRLTEDTVYSVGNLALTAHTASHLGVKAIAKRAAKDTGRAVLEDYKNKRLISKDNARSSESAMGDGNNEKCDKNLPKP